jgi:hypothetical protein
MLIPIDNCFSIGYRCNTDELMKHMNIRKYSSPFSYMVCDLETSIEFIQTEFQDFLNIISMPKHNFKWNGRKWNHHLFFNKKFISENDNVEINRIKNICVWNHHNLDNTVIVESIKRRYMHLLDADKSSNILYIYIDNIQIYDTDNWENYFPKETILNFIENKNRYILLVLPLLNYNNYPMLYTINTNLNVIFYKSNMDGYINDFGNSKIRWDMIKELILEKYSFDIKVQSSA